MFTWVMSLRDGHCMVMFWTLSLRIFGLWFDDVVTVLRATDDPRSSDLAATFLYFSSIRFEYFPLFGIESESLRLPVVRCPLMHCFFSPVLFYFYWKSMNIFTFNGTSPFPTLKTLAITSSPWNFFHFSQFLFHSRYNIRAADSKSWGSTITCWLACQTR